MFGARTLPSLDQNMWDRTNKTDETLCARLRARIGNFVVTRGGEKRRRELLCELWRLHSPIAIPSS